MYQMIFFHVHINRRRRCRPTTFTPHFSSSRQPYILWSVGVVCPTRDSGNVRFDSIVSLVARSSTRRRVQQHHAGPTENVGGGILRWCNLYTAICTKLYTFIFLTTIYERKEEINVINIRSSTEMRMPYAVHEGRDIK